jgi:hypothetical protein
MTVPFLNPSRPKKVSLMAKNNRKLTKANHGARPASAKARKAKRAKIKT